MKQFILRVKIGRIKESIFNNIFILILSLLLWIICGLWIFIFYIYGFEYIFTYSRRFATATARTEGLGLEEQKTLFENVFGIRNAKILYLNII